MPTHAQIEEAIADLRSQGFNEYQTAYMLARAAFDCADDVMDTATAEQHDADPTIAAEWAAAARDLDTAERMLLLWANGIAIEALARKSVDVEPLRYARTKIETDTLRADYRARMIENAMRMRVPE
jgi:hypothetical protein